ncbi:MAG TPA: hypothetical protein VHU23_15510 [Rhizomicrobium sp.]|jgi:hypothetical protein|nr:hypothetical protein [Rhizomicrobium sp.]
MHGLYTTAAVVLAGIIVYRFHRPIFGALARFDARNVARKSAEIRDRQDRNAHYKHTIELAEEQVDVITETSVTDSRTGAPVSHFAFAGEIFATREDAEAARQHAIIIKAREFYVELPVALTRRGGDGTLK